MPHVTPTGATHSVAPDEMFFSTTDSKGVIEESNAVFVKLSRFAEDELQGAPHNIIRHPEMPASAFQVMWDSIEDGSPFVAYVRNLAADGSEYDVVATITPLSNGGYLSVRTCISCEELFAAAKGIYAETLKKEKALREAGHNRRDTAALAVDDLAQLLTDAGFSSYEEFMMMLLPKEVATRAKQDLALPELGSPEDERMAAITREVATIGGGLNDWMESLDAIEGLRVALNEMVDNMREEMAESGKLATSLGEEANKGTIDASVLMPLEIWAKMRDAAAPRIEKLIRQLGDFDKLTAGTRFYMALGRLQAEMMTRFTAELSGGPSSNTTQIDGIHALSELADSFQLVVTHARALGEDYERKAGAVAKEIAGVKELMGFPQQLMVEWLVTNATKGSSLLRKVTDSLARTDELFGLLARTAKEASSADVLRGVDAADSAARRLRELTTTT